MNDDSESSIESVNLEISVEDENEPSFKSLDSQLSEDENENTENSILILEDLQNLTSYSENFAEDPLFLSEEETEGSQQVRLQDIQRVLNFDGAIEVQNFDNNPNVAQDDLQTHEDGTPIIAQCFPRPQENETVQQYLRRIRNRISEVEDLLHLTGLTNCQRMELENELLWLSDIDQRNKDIN